MLTAPNLTSHMQNDSTKTIAVDAMGGDFGLNTTVAGALMALENHRDISIILIGSETLIAEELQKFGSIPERLMIKNAPDVIGMGESVRSALRNKKNSSMHVGLELVECGRAQAFVSSGNTGALMAIARLILRTVPGIDRPALISSIPTINSPTYLLDLGANVDCTPQNLLEFGYLGAALVSTLHDKERPSIALLNIGVEDIKGSDLVKNAAKLFQTSSLNYRGYIEANDLFSGNVDVVVCDGFCGNIALKASEGLANVLLRHILKEEFNRNLWRKLGALVARPALRGLVNRLEAGNYNGANLIGLCGVVVKSHGGADARTFSNAISVATSEIEHGLLEKIQRSKFGALGDVQPS